MAEMPESKDLKKGTGFDFMYSKTLLRKIARSR